MSASFILYIFLGRPTHDQPTTNQRPPKSGQPHTCQCVTISHVIEEKEEIFFFFFFLPGHKHISLVHMMRMYRGQQSTEACRVITYIRVELKSYLDLGWWAVPALLALATGRRVCPCCQVGLGHGAVLGPRRYLHGCQLSCIQLLLRDRQRGQKEMDRGHRVKDRWRRKRERERTRDMNK